MEGRIHMMYLSNISHTPNLWPEINPSDYHDPPHGDQSRDVTMAYEDPVVPLQPSALETPLSPRNIETEQHIPEKKARISLHFLIKLDELWRMRKDAHWEIVAPSNKRDQADVPPNPAARSRPVIWSENLCDAQDALTYFSVGQTILTSKIPRVHARSVLLTKNLRQINADWRSGQITFSLHLKYRIDFARPRNWGAPDLTHGFELLEENRKPPDPLQFRKLMACRDTGVPVKLLATGDFPSLPVVDSETKLDDGTSLKISSDKWRNGLVVLGFFWVKQVQEDADKHVFIGELDIDDGKCSGEAHWNFEFQSCNSRTPPWWRPLVVDCENEPGRDDSDDLNTPAKRPRCDPDERKRGEEMDIDQDSEFDKMDSAIYIQPEVRVTSHIH
ncbi:hypothetical protein FRC06_001313 [Ceratobasidium sp. 370]|nr:hypothetical protein FRC06_001313 [Ceratobasidium sp. 370]